MERILITRICNSFSSLSCFWYIRLSLATHFVNLILIYFQFYKTTFWLLHVTCWSWKDGLKTDRPEPRFSFASGGIWYRKHGNWTHLFQRMKLFWAGMTISCSIIDYATFHDLKLKVCQVTIWKKMCVGHSEGPINVLSVLLHSQAFRWWNLSASCQCTLLNLRGKLWASKHLPHFCLFVNPCALILSHPWH